MISWVGVMPSSVLPCWSCQRGLRERLPLMSNAAPGGVACLHVRLDFHGGLLRVKLRSLHRATDSTASPSTDTLFRSSRTSTRLIGSMASDRPSLKDTAGRPLRTFRVTDGANRASRGSFLPIPTGRSPMGGAERPPVQPLQGRLDDPGHAAVGTDARGRRGRPPREVKIRIVRPQ
jgi:hypothetical protein